MNVLDLFSGIGGFSLGLERAGMRTVAFCEIDPYCQAVLNKHWPDVPIFGDVRTLTGEALADANGGISKGEQSRSGSAGIGSEGWQSNAKSSGIDVICGGFPCQDISVAGKGAGIDGECSGLWTEFARIIGEVRPRYVIVENVSALLGRGLGVVLGDLAALGFDAEWHCIPASAVGAPHRRDRIWIVAYPNGGGQRRTWASDEIDRSGMEGKRPSCFDAGARGSEGVADTSCEHRSWGAAWHGWRSEVTRNDPQECGRGYRSANVQWLVEPDVGRVAHGVPARVDRLRSLGNAIVPQIAEIIGRAIMAERVSC